jgi:NADPH:quinone reductase-like Zn-dependent oxidoreductase
MNAVYFNRRGGPEALVYGAATMPGAAEGEIVVRVRAAAVTPTELLWVPTWTTRASKPRPFPIIPGHEFSGEVHVLGSGVSDVAVGDAVFGMNDWFGDGAQAEFCVARSADVAPKPTSIDHVTAAVVPISALTAWQGLVERAKLTRGERVLVHGAAGNVGLFAVQIAHGIGAHVIGTASGHDLEFVRSLGADEVIDYRARSFADAVTGLDVVFDTVGGDTLARSWGVLRRGGTMVTTAADAEQTREQRVKDAFFIVEPNREQLTRISRMIDAGKLRVFVGAAFPLQEASQAYTHKPVRGKNLLVADR